VEDTGATLDKIAAETTVQTLKGAGGRLWAFYSLVTAHIIHWWIVIVYNGINCGKLSNLLVSWLIISYF
jgi:hypothetical protein